MRMRLAVVTLVVLLCATVGFAQEMAFPDPSGVWVGQLVAAHDTNRGWHATMTLTVAGDVASGVFEWVDLFGAGQTFTGFRGTWDAGSGKLVVRERVLFEDTRGMRTEEGEYSIQLLRNAPGVAWGTVKSPTVSHGGFYLTKLGGLPSVTDITGRWQGFPATNNAALNLVVLRSDGGLVGEGSYLDRNERTVQPLAAKLESVAGRPDRWTVEASFGADGKTQMTYEADLDASRCVLRLRYEGKTAALLVRRG